MSEKGRKFLKNCFPGKIFWTHRMQFWQLCWKLFNKKVKNFAHYPQMAFFIKFFLNVFQLTLRWQFWRPRQKKTETEGRLFSRKFRNLLKKITFVKQFNFPEFFSMDTWNAVLTTLLKFFKQKAGNCFTQCLQRIVFSRKMFPSNWFQESSNALLTTLVERFDREPENSAQCQKVLKNIFKQKVCFFPQIFLCTRGTQFWRTRSKNCEKKWKFFRAMSEIEKGFLRSMIWLRIFLWTRRRQF